MNTPQPRVIMLVDMQSFYASCEIAAHPEYEKKPLVVSGDPARRSGIILAANPLAKQYGVTTAETLGEALGKCPDAIVQRPHMQYYIDLSLQITQVLQTFSDLVEPYSIDEQFVDMTQTLHLFGSPERAAELIQAKIMEETGVYARAGISYNKVVAKMACDNFAKKNDTGIFTLHKEDLPTKLWKLPIHKMFLVGSRMTQHLIRMGIHTIGDLAQTSMPTLRAKWGVNGELLWRIANGIDDSPVSLTAHDGQKGIGHQMTLPRDYESAEELMIVLLELTELVCYRSRQKGYIGWVASVGCQGADFDHPQGFYRQMKMTDPTNVTNVVYEYVKTLFKRHWQGYPVRKVGVTLTDLVPDSTYQLTMFDDSERLRKLEKTTDLIKSKYGDTAIMRAVSASPAGQAKDRSRKIGGHYR